ncbi:MAG: SseB family protein [Rhodobacteraceae bacterium]|nr:MAG: SseB family protein [Paracoccaceae bacterium]
MTPLDAAHAAAEAPGAPESARLRFYALLLETTLCVPVEPGPEDAALRPRVFPLEAGPVALAFDDDGRMAGFFGGPTDYVSLTGRALAAAAAGAGVGLGLNLDAPSATLLPAEAVAWLAAEMGGGAEAADLSGPVTVAAPTGIDGALLAALAERLAGLPGMVAEAWLVRLERPEASELALLLLPAPAARRAGEGLAALLGRVAAAAGAASVAVGLLDDGHALLGPARAKGVGLHPGPAPEAPAAKPAGPPRLR